MSMMAILKGNLVMDTTISHGLNKVGSLVDGPSPS